MEQTKRRNKRKQRATFERCFIIIIIILTVRPKQAQTHETKPKTKIQCHGGFERAGFRREVAQKDRKGEKKEKRKRKKKNKKKNKKKKKKKKKKGKNGGNSTQFQKKMGEKIQEYKRNTHKGT